MHFNCTIASSASGHGSETFTACAAALASAQCTDDPEEAVIIPDDCIAED